MTELQKRVCQEWVIDFNAQKAGERAGVQGDNIRITVWQMLQLPEVQEYIQELQDAAAVRCQVSKDELLNEFKKIGFANIENYMDSEYNAKLLNEVKNTEAIKSVKKTVKEGPVSTETTIEFTLHDKLSALTSIGRHIGFFSEDNKQRNPNTPLMPLDPLSNVDDTANDSPAENSGVTQAD